MTNVELEIKVRKLEELVLAQAHEIADLNARQDSLIKEILAMRTWGGAMVLKETKILEGMITIVQKPSRLRFVADSDVVEYSAVSESSKCAQLDLRSPGMSDALAIMKIEQCETKDGIPVQRLRACEGCDE